MVVTGSGAGLLNSETAKAVVSAGMASGLAGTTRAVGIIAGVAGLGAVLAAVSERTLKTLGRPLAAGQAIDGHGLSLRIVGGDATSALSALPGALRTATGPAVHRSIAAGFGSVLAMAALVGLAAGVPSWRLIRPTAQP